jgi:RNA processing factor Prp31
MQDIIKELDSISNMIKENENKRARLEGEKESLMKQLSEKFEIGSIREAKKKLQEMQEEKEKLEEAINKQMEELREILPV